MAEKLRSGATGCSKKGVRPQDFHRTLFGIVQGDVCEDKKLMFIVQRNRLERNLSCPFCMEEVFSGEVLRRMSLIGKCLNRNLSNVPRHCIHILCFIRELSPPLIFS